jgi:hypothetical protein
MNDFLELLKKKASRFLKLWPDVWALPFAIAGFFLSFYILRWIDPYAGTFDVGYLQALMLSALFIVATNTIVFLGIRYNFDFLWKHYKEDLFDKDWLKLTPWRRFVLLLCLYSLLFSLSVAVFVAII